MKIPPSSRLFPQVVVQVRGWNHVTPVSVDKVGTYFRVAKQKQPETKLLDVGASSANVSVMESQVTGFVECCMFIFKQLSAL